MKRLIVCAALGLAGCQDTSDQKMNAAQERLAAEAASEVGMPAIVNFQEKRTMKTILELRDQAISTTTYLVTLDGALVKLCDSIGYGLPYATQYTSPSKISAGEHVVPQADPNGLFSPASADGTWVLCLDPARKATRPVYVEPRIIVSPFPLSAGGDVP